MFMEWVTAKGGHMAKTLPLRQMNTTQGVSFTQDFTRRAFQDLSQRNPILGGNIVEATILTTDTTVSHGLGRQVQGWTIVSINGDANVWSSSTANDNPDRTYILKASAQVDVKVLFF